MKTSITVNGGPQRTPLPHCRCGNVIPRKDKNIKAVNCPRCVQKLLVQGRKMLEEGRVRFADTKVAE